MKIEKLIIGLILVIVGFGLLYFGYQKLHPSFTEQVVELFTDEGRQARFEGYLFMILGGIAALSGFYVMLQSRK